MQTEEQVERAYRGHLQGCSRHRENYEAAGDPYFYGLHYGAATALGFVLGKKLPEIEREIKAAERRGY